MVLDGGQCFLDNAGAYEHRMMLLTACFLGTEHITESHSALTVLSSPHAEAWRYMQAASKQQASRKVPPKHRASIFRQIVLFRPSGHLNYMDDGLLGKEATAHLSSQALT